MRQRIKRALTNNVGLKILALVFSFFLWLVVVNIDDPTQTRTFTAVVTVTNEDVLTKAGKLYSIKDGINTVSFRVTAKRSIIEKLSTADFTAVADMNYLESEERIPVTITANSFTNYVTISSKQNYLYVELEDQLTSRFVIDAKTSGDPDPGVAIESVVCSPTVITVTGPEEKVSSISTVEAVCDITGVAADITESVIPKFYDENGDEVDAGRLQLSVSTVDVSVDFVNMKSVDIAVKTSGVLPSYLQLGSITTDPSSVIIKGEAVDLNEVTNITIPDTVINLSNAVGSYSTVVDISAYLPSGVTLQDNSNAKVTIYVKMAGEESKSIEVPRKNIELANLDEGLEAVIDSETVNTYVFGTAEGIEAINGAHVSGIVDCGGLSVGEQQAVVVHFAEVEGVTIQNVSITVTVKASEKTENEEE